MAQRRNSTDNPDDGELTYLQQMIGGKGLNAGCEKALGTYFEGLTHLHTEHKHPVLPNEKLDAYVAARGERRRTINIASSETCLPPHEPAIDAVATAMDAKHKEIYATLVEKKDALEQAGTTAHFTGELRRRLRDIRRQELADLPFDMAFNLLGKTLSLMKPESVSAVQDELKKAGQSCKELEECFTHRDPRFAPKLPRDSKTQSDLKAQAISTTLMCCDEMLEGTYSKTEGLLRKVQRLEKETLDEQKRVSSEEFVRPRLTPIIEDALKPAVIRTMHDLHDIAPEIIKPENICLCEGSSTQLVTAALKTLVEPPANKWFSKPQKKKLIHFSMSWDGLKTFAADNNMENSIVPGPISAKALEGHIRHNILGDRHTDDTEAAKAEIRNRVGALLINSPENPLGKIASEEEMRALAKVVEKYDIPLVVCDEIFAAPGHQSLMNYPGMAERCYVISSTSKNINYEAKIAFGYSANDDFAQRVIVATKDKEPRIMNATGYATLLGETPKSYYQKNQQEYKRKRKLVNKTLKAMCKKLKHENALHWHTEPNYGCLGTLCVDKKLTDGCGIENSAQLAEYIYKLGGVMVMPTGDVYPDKEPLGVRINFSDDDETIRQGIERIGIAVEYMQEKKRYSEIEGEKYRGKKVVSSGLPEMLAAMFGGSNVKIIGLDDL